MPAWEFEEDKAKKEPDRICLFSSLKDMSYLENAYCVCCVETSGVISTLADKLIRPC